MSENNYTDLKSKAQELTAKLLQDTQVKPKKGTGNKNSRINSTTPDPAVPDHLVNFKTTLNKRRKAALGISDSDARPLPKPKKKDVVQNILGPELLQELKERFESSKQAQLKANTNITNVLFKPHPGPQTDFLASIEYEVAFVGGRNSGKSACLLVDPLRFVRNPNFKGLFIRKTMAALREIIARAKQLYPKMYPGTKWKEQDKIFEFPSGATIEFGYFDHIDDYDRYHGREFAWVGIDEITQYESQDYYDKLKSVVRSVDPQLKPRIRCTCNPVGPGRVWIKDYFDIETGVPTKVHNTVVYSGTTEIIISRKYIKSTIFDNPTAIENDPQYLAYLESLPEIQRRQMLEGDFEANEGLAFEEFSRHRHIIDPTAIPNNWLKIRAIDWGFRSKAVCLWIAFDYDGNAYVYREYVTGGGQTLADEFARNVLDLEANEFVTYGVVDGGVATSSGVNGPTVEEDFLKEGLACQHADKSKRSRPHGKMMIHKYLKVDEVTGKPRLFIFNTCKQLIKELSSLMINPHNSEDINDKMEDHAYDALRYGLSSRPEPSQGGTSDAFGRARYSSLNSTPIIVNSTMGY